MGEGEGRGSSLMGSRKEANGFCGVENLKKVQRKQERNTTDGEETDLASVSKKIAVVLLDLTVISHVLLYASLC